MPSDSQLAVALLTEDETREINSQKVGSSTRLSGFESC